jgi:hypothetical protein
VQLCSHGPRSRSYLAADALAGVGSSCTAWLGLLPIWALVRLGARPAQVGVAAGGLQASVQSFVFGSGAGLQEKRSRCGW